MTAKNLAWHGNGELEDFQTFPTFDSQEAHTIFKGKLVRSSLEESTKLDESPEVQIFRKILAICGICWEKFVEVKWFITLISHPQNNADGNL